ncbi:MAG: hypothetical protein LUQ37_10545 [Methanoregulaceae archaeon]|nr:hypothetical protein [Methanoregulaceae archaeon]
MKRIFILLCITLFAIFSAGCTSNDSGTTTMEQQSAYRMVPLDSVTNTSVLRAPFAGYPNAT